MGDLLGVLSSAVCAVEKLTDDFTQAVIEMDSTVLDDLENDIKRLTDDLTTDLEDLIQDVDNEDDNQSSSSSKAESSSTRSSSFSSCSGGSTTATQTWVGTACLVTSGAPASATPACATNTTSIVITTSFTDCPFSFTTTTSTSVTTTVTASANVYCDVNNCANSGCPAAAAGKQGIFEKRDPPTRQTEPPQGVWADASNYGGDTDAFFRGEVALAYTQGNGLSISYNNANRPSTSTFAPFENDTNTVALAGLYGCTSVVVVSQLGVWVSHLYEVPSFFLGIELAPENVLSWWRVDASDNLVLNDFGFPILDSIVVPAIYDPNSFTETVIDWLPAGYDADAEGSTNPGVNNFRNGVSVREALVPYENVLNDVYDPVVFIMTPLPRSTDQGIPAGSLLYQDQITQIQTTVTQLFSGYNLALRMVPYQPIEIGQLGAGVPQGDPGYTSSRGKLLVQYQPAAGCSGDAKYRLWFEAQELTTGTPTSTDSWLEWAEVWSQTYGIPWTAPDNTGRGTDPSDAPGKVMWTKRQAACSLPVSSVPPSSSTKLSPSSASSPNSATIVISPSPTVPAEPNDICSCAYVSCVESASGACASVACCTAYQCIDTVACATASCLGSTTLLPASSTTGGARCTTLVNGCSPRDCESVSCASGLAAVCTPMPFDLTARDPLSVCQCLVTTAAAVATATAARRAAVTAAGEFLGIETTLATPVATMSLSRPTAASLSFWW